MQSNSESTTFFDLYSSLVSKRYGSQPYFDYFLREMHLAYHWTISNCKCLFIESTDGCALVFQSINGVVSFGFAHFPEQVHIAQQIWNKVINAGREFKSEKLSGPLQGNTFFPYRFIYETDGSPFFKGEYFSSTSDHAFMLGQKPSNVLYFRSGFRTRYDGVMAVSKPYYDAAAEKGFRSVAHSSVDEKLFKDVFHLIGRIFGNNWAFQQLTESELKAIYQQEFSKSTRLMLQTYFADDVLIGFCRFVENEADVLICKTLGILPEYQKMGLGNAAAYQMHFDAQRLNYDRMIYALIYDGNRVQQNMPKDDSVIFRKYASYEFSMK